MSDPLSASSRPGMCLMSVVLPAPTRRDRARWAGGERSWTPAQRGPVTGDGFAKHCRQHTPRVSADARAIQAVKPRSVPNPSSAGQEMQQRHEEGGTDDRPHDGKRITADAEDEWFGEME